MRVLIKYLSILLIIFFPESSHKIAEQIISKSPESTQQEAVHNLIRRTIGEDAFRKFFVTVDKKLPFRSFEISKREDSVITIKASDGVSALKGFHYYLKYYLHKDVSWTSRYIDLSSLSEFPNVTVTSASASEFIYYQNVCTWSYSFAWWDWSTWQNHIDWMALMGITLTIAPVQEQIWYEIFYEIGLNESEINDHFAGPAFQAWQRMGNIRGWAGPISATYRRMQQLLQKQIIKAQRDLGMTVALPAFAGHVPKAMTRLYPSVNFTVTDRWNNFQNSYCCVLFLDPNEQLFLKLGKTFLLKIIEVYGSDHIYFADPFNEMQPRLADATYMNLTAFHIYNSMHSIDSNAVWLLQGWMFVKNLFWTDNLIKAFLTAVPHGKLLILDLQSEQFPQYERTHSYHGQPFIWCMLHNFGGTLGMHGSADIINTRIREARNMPNSSMIGVGITPEGIHQNYVMYSLTLERAWNTDDFDLHLWFDKFSDVRYGVEDERLRAVWQLLRTSVYSFHGLKKLRGKYSVTRRPSLNLNPWTWYNSTSIHQALLLLIAANESMATDCDRSLYEHDLVDLSRQFLQQMADKLYVNFIDAFKKNQLDRINYIGKKLLQIFDDMERILATSRSFMIGTWLKAATKMAITPADKRLYEMNALNQISVWGPNGEILDYANKQWSGIISQYYKLRWELFITMIKDSLKSNVSFNKTLFNAIVSREIENPFSTITNSFPMDPLGNTLEIAQNIFNNWTSLCHNQAYVHYVYLNVRVIQI